MRESLFDGIIECKTIPHNQQRYDTVGDWWTDSYGWHIRVSYLGDWRYQFLVAIHEFVEMAWCRWNGVDPSAVDTFDMQFEDNRKEGDYSEPGDARDAPYWKGHQFATAIERMAAVMLAVDWTAYEAAIRALVYDKENG